MGDFVITNEPLKILLEDAIREGVAKFVDDRIQTGFGRGRLPTAIEDGDEIIAHLGDQVTVKANFRNTIGRGDSGILQFPVGVAFDGGVHLGFDLTHVWCRFG